MCALISFWFPLYSPENELDYITVFGVFVFHSQTAWASESLQECPEAHIVNRLLPVHNGCFLKASHIHSTVNLR